MYYEDKENCVLLGVAKDHHADSGWECAMFPVYSSPMVDRAYTPRPCSRLSDVVGPPNIGMNGRINGLKSCGNAFEKVVLEYILSLSPYSRPFIIEHLYKPISNPGHRVCYECIFQTKIIFLQRRPTRWTSIGSGERDWQLRSLGRFLG